MAGASRYPKIGVVIPAYKVADHVLGVLARIGPEVSHIIVVDDNCPAGSGQIVQERSTDPRVTVLFHAENAGVGGAVVSGYKRAIELGVDIAVKIDGDGQIPPELLPSLVTPIVLGEADYAKGNRFFNPEDVKGMPPVRLFGNAALSFFTKMSSGYWSVFDPTNGFTAVHTSVLPLLRMDRLARRYFFESDMLFRLNLLRCRVVDMPMAAVYDQEESNLRVSKVFHSFLWSNIRNTHKRIVYNYFIRNFSVASLYFLLSVPMLMFGAIFGLYGWARSIHTDVPSASGTVMLAALPIMIGLQLLLAFLAYDVASEPGQAIHPRLLRRGTLLDLPPAEASRGAGKQA